MWSGALGELREPAPLWGSPASSPPTSCGTVALLALPARRSWALAVPLPTQLSHWPGQLNTWGQEAQETGNGSLGHLCRF